MLLFYFDRYILLILLQDGDDMKDTKKVMNRLLSQDIDISILKYISDALVGIEDQLEIAIAIYIKLAELFWYDPIFIVENDYELVEDLQKISVDNNEIICLHWAIIYSRLLNMYGVMNILCGDDEHLMVKVMVDKWIISADATKYGVEYKDYLLADLTNTKLGLRIQNFNTLSEVRNKELNVIIDRVYEKLGIKCFDMSKFERLLEKFKKYTRRKIASNILGEKHRISRDDILYRIRFINYFYNMSIKLREVERMQFFSKYYKSVFEGFNFENCRCLTLCELRSYHLIRLLVMETDDKQDYYFLETEKGFIEYDKDTLIDEFIKRNVVFKYDICGVLGFKDDEVQLLSKKK